MTQKSTAWVSQALSDASKKMDGWTQAKRTAMENAVTKVRTSPTSDVHLAMNLTTAKAASEA